MSTYAPCPHCQNTQASPVRYTWWGGVLGPKMLTHVKCGRCGTAYNGKTGGSNSTAIAVYLVVGGLIFFVIVFVIAFARAFM